MLDDEPDEEPHFYSDAEDLPSDPGDIAEDATANRAHQQGDDDDNVSDIVEGGDVDAAEAARRRKAEAARQKKKLNSIQEEVSKKIPKEKRTTTPYMTKYERARILGTRSMQIRSVTDCALQPRPN